MKGRPFRDTMWVDFNLMYPERRASWTMLNNFGLSGNRC
jgi:hypothetical protein